MADSGCHGIDARCNSAVWHSAPLCRAAAWHRGTARSERHCERPSNLRNGFHLQRRIQRINAKEFYERSFECAFQPIFYNSLESPTTKQKIKFHTFGCQSFKENICQIRFSLNSVHINDHICHHQRNKSVISDQSYFHVTI